MFAAEQAGQGATDSANCGKSEDFSLSEPNATQYWLLLYFRHNGEKPHV
jgi:hypothetical protein